MLLAILPRASTAEGGTDSATRRKDGNRSQTSRSKIDAGEDAADMQKMRRGLLSVAFGDTQQAMIWLLAGLNEMRHRRFKILAEARARPAVPVQCLQGPRRSGLR